MAGILHLGKTAMHSGGNRCGNAQRGIAAFAASRQTLPEHQYAGFVLKQLANRIGTEVPAFRKLSDTVMALIDSRPLFRMQEFGRRASALRLCDSRGSVIERHLSPSERRPEKTATALRCHPTAEGAHHR
jgi:hypothetical protein